MAYNMYVKHISVCFITCLNKNFRISFGNYKNPCFKFFILELDVPIGIGVSKRQAILCCFYFTFYYFFGDRVCSVHELRVIYLAPVNKQIKCRCQFYYQHSSLKSFQPSMLSFNIQQPLPIRLQFFFYSCNFLRNTITYSLIKLSLLFSWLSLNIVSDRLLLTYLYLYNLHQLFCIACADLKVFFGKATGLQKSKY